MTYKKLIEQAEEEITRVKQFIKLYQGEKMSVTTSGQEISFAQFKLAAMQWKLFAPKKYEQVDKTLKLKAKILKFVRNSK